MRKSLLTLMCLAAMLTAGTSAKAQEVTITLSPGWTWIGYLGTEPQDFATALGSFTPEVGDVIKSQWGYASYGSNGQWRGSISQFYPGYGYHYWSNRQIPVTVTIGTPLPQLSVTTTEPTDITLHSATSGGSITTDAYVFAKGICWATHANPTPMEDDHSENEGGNESFTAEMTDLTPNTMYYVSAYVVTDYGLTYGNELSFTTLSGIPVVTTTEVTDVTGNSALCGGTVTDGGGLEITARGVCWSTSPNPTLSDSHTTDGTGTGSFTSSITGLSTSTTYYVRAYATTSQATSYGEEMTFTTMSGIPTVSTAEVTDITTNSATCGGTIATDGGLAITARGVCWSTSSTPTIVDAHSTDGTGTGNFSSTLTGLTPNTTYFVRAYATNSYVTVYGNQRSFTTEPLPIYTVSVSCNPTEGGTITGDGTFEQGQGCTLTATANDGYTFTNWTENGEVVSTNATYTFTVSADRTLVANFIQGGSGGDHAYVDLGLPSGLLWATCNVGADSPEDYGDYFAWGETQPKDTYSWSTYQYCNGDYNQLTKYCNNSNYGYNGFTDNLTTLLPEDDAATANWGSDWRMPTREEWQELLNNTTVTRTTQNGVNGCLFTASNGNSLFLPAAGYRDGSSLYSVGSNGYYWSSSLSTDFPCSAWYFYFDSDFYCMYDFYGRDYGRSVRGVRSSRQN